MAEEPRLIIQVAQASRLERWLRDETPEAVALGTVVVESEPADGQGELEAPAAGEVVLSVLSPEALAREADEVRRVIARAGQGDEPLVVLVAAAEELRDEERAAVLDAAGHSKRPVILRVTRDA